MDAVTSHSGDLLLRRAVRAGGAMRPVVSQADRGLSRNAVDNLWRVSEAADFGLTCDRFGEVLRSLGRKLNHGLPAGTFADSAQQVSFFRVLRLPELALAQACALGMETAWTRFRHVYRASLIQMAMRVAGSTALIDEDANELYAGLGGPDDNDRVSPLAAYTGRCSLKTWLNTLIAQRHLGNDSTGISERRRQDAGAPGADILASPDDLLHMAGPVARALQTMTPEEAYLLSAYFVDQRSMSEIGRVLGLAETIVEQRLKKLATSLRGDLLRDLQLDGMSKRDAEEKLGMDARTLQIGIGLRVLLQRSQLRSFSSRNHIVLKPERTTGHGPKYDCP